VLAAWLTSLAHRAAAPPAPAAAPPS